MGSVTQNEVVDADNPLIFFANQITGKLDNVVSLKRSVFTVPLTGSPVEVEAEAVLDLTDAPTGTRLGVGVYHANFTAPATIGTHEIRWKFIHLTGGPEVEVRQQFEVLDANDFFKGKAYVGYASSTTLKGFTELAAKTIRELQVLTDEASREIEQLTGRFFEPRFLVERVDTKKTRGILLQSPIIGVNKVEIESSATGINIELGEISLDGLRIYARHLDGLLDPDDRDDPRIEIERFEGIIFQSLDFFPLGPQVTHVTGVFGYTNANGSPFGQTPKNLTNAIGHMLVRKFVDPLGQNETITNPSAISSAKTRDQAVKFGGGGGGTKGGGRSGREAYGGLTGDDFLDRILIPYVRPFHMRAV